MWPCDVGSACLFFFFNDTATTEIYTLSLHDALPISRRLGRSRGPRRLAQRGRRSTALQLHRPRDPPPRRPGGGSRGRDRKSTRLNSSHLVISYAVFCLKKKRTYKRTHPARTLSIRMC